MIPYFGSMLFVLDVYWDAFLKTSFTLMKAKIHCDFLLFLAYQYLGIANLLTMNVANCTFLITLPDRCVDFSVISNLPLDRCT